MHVQVGHVALAERDQVALGPEVSSTATSFPSRVTVKPISASSPAFEAAPASLTL